MAYVPASLAATHAALTGQGAARQGSASSAHTSPAPPHRTPSHADTLHSHVVQPVESVRKPYMHILGQEMAGHLGKHREAVE